MTNGNYFESSAIIIIIHKHKSSLDKQALCY